MKKVLVLCAAALPVLAQLSFDFKSLDKLGANAKESTSISLDGDMLKAAGGLVGDQESVKPLLEKLKAVYVREFKFAKPGQYDEGYLAHFRTYMKSLQWSKIIDVKDEKESTEIYAQIPSKGQTGGFAIISAEPMEVSVVFISGPINMDDFGKLSARLGIPEMTLDHGRKKSDK
jgi:hypothetical protein